MAIPLSTMQEFQDKRVRMRFDDDVECLATLNSITRDMDGSLHLIYDKVEWTNDPRDWASAKESTFHAEGESLVSIEEVA